ncbi:hypothetical protein BG006_010748 [Podila minutissima]|uniref:Uncharacterized protein n=1 Tax=Podila minutissima TaxID=64525 RepID=A0A9P5VIJ7_9FUNG|nr:hypothetical protein BG006_010748 [Podila minutissima]
MYNEFGPVWAISLPGIGTMIQGDSPEIVEHVLKTSFRAYEKGLILKGATGDLFRDDNKEKRNASSSLMGSRWRFQRKLASHIFNVKAFKEYVSEVFVNEGYKVIEHEIPFAVSFDGLNATCSDLLVDPAWRFRERFTTAGANAQHDKNLIAQLAYALMENAAY